MGSWARAISSLGAVLSVATLWAGCDAIKQTEYVSGISTQVQVPRDMKTIRVDVSVGGANVFCNTYRTYDGRVQLPKSLGEFPTTGDHAGIPVTITVVGFSEDVADPNRQLEFDCAKQIKPGENARILRRSRQPYVTDRILFLPMPLRYSCFDTNCETPSGDQTCKAGRCVDGATDPSLLPAFSPELVDGTGGACFPASQCLAAAVPAAVVNASDCTYAVPNTPSAPAPIPGAPPNPFPSAGDGVNVEVVFDGGFNVEILDKDPDEGFAIPDPSKPQRFRLAPGLCDMVKGVDAGGAAVAHRITAVRTSGACRAKSVYQPLCASDMLAAMGASPAGTSGTASSASACRPLELKPAKAALMVIVDDTDTSSGFYKGSTADEAVLNVSLEDPAFERTDIGLIFFPGVGSCAASQPFTPKVPLEAALKAQKDIAKAIGDEATSLKPGGTYDMSGALHAAYDAVQDPKYFRRGVLIIGNHGFDTNACGDKPADRAAAALAANGTLTYSLLLTSDPGDSSVPPEYDLVGKNGRAWDARTNKASAADAQSKIVDDLATCAYVVDGGPLPADGGVLSYTNPITSATTPIAFAGACTNEGAAVDGWGKDGAGHVFVCGKPCADYQAVLRDAAGYAALSGQPAIAVPMFAHTAGCAPKAGVPSNTAPPGP